MKVYTKTGDKGTTSLIGGERVFKTDERVEAYGSVDELAAPLDPAVVTWLEGRIDAMQEALQPIDKFTIPGGHTAVSLCHVCRTVCRRSERAALRADAKYGVEPSVLVWLNRLSDYFYLLGRTLTAHYEVKEVLWIP